MNKKRLILVILIFLVLVLGALAIVFRKNIFKNSKDSNNPKTSQKEESSQPLEIKQISTSDDAIEAVKQLNHSENYDYQIEQETYDEFVVVVYDSNTLDSVAKYNINKNSGVINSMQDIEIESSSVIVGASGE